MRRVLSKVAFLTLFLAVPLYAGDPPGPFDPPEARIHPPGGVAVQAHIHPPTGAPSPEALIHPPIGAPSPDARIHPPIGMVVQAEIHPPIGAPEPGFLGSLLDWLRSQLGISTPTR